jgi:hypothetical protein
MSLLRTFLNFVANQKTTIMKKLLLFVLALIFINAGYTQSNISNGDLENWYLVTGIDGPDYYQLGTNPNDRYLNTLNELGSLPFPTIGPVTAYRSTDSYSGTYACKLVSADFTAFGIFIPGMIGTATLDMQGVRALIGRPCAGCKPLHLKGYYKFEPVGGDSGSVVCLVSKWNAVAKHRDTIGFGKVVFTAPVAAYTPFDVQVAYPGSSLSPDSLTILCVSSAGYSVINFEGGVGQAGSTMYVDELMLEYPAGIEQSLMPEVNVKVYPDPANEVVTFETGQPVKQGTIEIYDLSGKSMQVVYLSGLKNSCPVNNLSNGTYYFKLRGEGHVLNTGSFVVHK